MNQPALLRRQARFIERRCDARKPAAFTLWYQRPGRSNWLGGWAMNISAGGLAMLVEPAKSPRLGELIQLVPQDAPSAIIASAIPHEFPSCARVVRLDELDGLTRRLALAFEPAQKAELHAGADNESDARTRPTVAGSAAAGQR